MFFVLLGLFVSLYYIIFFLTERDMKLYRYGDEENTGGAGEREDI